MQVQNHTICQPGHQGSRCQSVKMKVIQATIFLVGVVLFASQNCHALQARGKHASSQEILSVLKDCVVSSGSNPSDIVEYLVDDLAVYTELNYQWNLIHERKYPLGYFTVRNANDVQAAVRCATAQVSINICGGFIGLCNLKVPN